MNHRVGRLLLLVSPVLLFLGCGGGSGTQPTGTVSGTVSYNKEPVGNVNVNFISTGGNGAAATVEAEFDGTFKLSEPIPTGNYKVFISPLPPGPPTQGAPPMKSTLPKIPPVYLQLETSTLTAEVKTGANSFDLVMK